VLRWNLKLLAEAYLEHLRHPIWTRITEVTVLAMLLNYQKYLFIEAVGLDLDSDVLGMTTSLGIADQGAAGPDHIFTVPVESRSGWDWRIEVMLSDVGLIQLCNIDVCILIQRAIAWICWTCKINQDVVPDSMDIRTKLIIRLLHAHYRLLIIWVV